MLDIRYIVGSLIITVAVVAFFASLILPIDRNPNASASLKPRIEPSKIAEPAPAPQTPKQAIAPAPQPVAPAPKQAIAPAPVQTSAAKEATAPVPAGPKQPIAQAQPPAPETTGSIGEKKPVAKPAPRRIVQPKKEEPAFQFPWFKGFGQQ